MIKIQDKITEGRTLDIKNQNKILKINLKFKNSLKKLQKKNQQNNLLTRPKIKLLQINPQINKRQSHPKTNLI